MSNDSTIAMFGKMRATLTTAKQTKKKDTHLFLNDTHIANETQIFVVNTKCKSQLDIRRSVAPLPIRDACAPVNQHRPITPESLLLFLFFVFVFVSLLSISRR